MGRIAERFSRLRAKRAAALVSYVMAGDPDPRTTVPLLRALVSAGADLLELGVPFSDPMADGPVIQRAAERALARGMTLAHVFDMVREFRAQDTTTPIVLMGYLNPVEAMGYARFAERAAQAGVDGVLTVDLPPEEAEDFLSALAKYGLDPIFLAAPTSGEARLRAIGGVARGFIYYVSLRGVTGARHLDPDEVAERLRAIRRHTDLPLGVGFGIDGPEAAARVGLVADAVVVGSAIVSRIEAHAAEPNRLLDEVTAFVGSLRAAMDAARARAASAARTRA